MTDDRLVVFDNATIVRAGSETPLAHLEWTLREGQTWAIVGPVASGKTTLAEAIADRHRLQSGSLTWPLIERLRAAGRELAWPAQVLRTVSFKEESWQFSYAKHYYQQRFNFIEAHDDLTLAEFLRSRSTATEDEVLAAARQLGVGDLLSLSLIKLSNGQMRRARIARALAARPEILILDDPFIGLDAAGRVEVTNVLEQVVESGIRIVLITKPDAIPQWVTHVLEMESMRIVSSTPRAEYLPPPNTSHPSDDVVSQTGDPILELKDVTVRYGERDILHKLNWTVRPGERWAVLGPNGSGKTTLLSLLCGDHPQAYSNDIWLFGRKRGTGESIWDIKSQIGLVSPELHLYFTEPLTAAQTAATGFFDVLTLRRTSPEQEQRVRVLFAFFGITPLAERPFSRLSTGEQRIVLLVRALVKHSPLLILDEPFQALDASLIAKAHEWLDSRLRPEQAVLFVSHYEQEIPRSVNRRLRLEAGHRVE